MKEFPKPRLVVSTCAGAPASVGATCAANLVQQLEPYVDLVLVCPEAEAHLPAPDSLRVVADGDGRRLAARGSEDDLTPALTEFGARFLSSLDDVDGFILKGGSPCDGPWGVKVYANVWGEEAVGRCAAPFAELIVARFPHAIVEDDVRVTNPRIRDHFLSATFARAGFREARAAGRLPALAQYHAANKYLFTAYDEEETRTMNGLLANRAGLSGEEVFADYEEHLHMVLHRTPRCPRQVDVLLHALGFLDRGLTAGERQQFQVMVEGYRSGKKPLSMCVLQLRSWILRAHDTYLLGQTLFEPYPAALMQTEAG